MTAATIAVAATAAAAATDEAKDRPPGPVFFTLLPTTLPVKKNSIDTATAWFGALCFFLSTIEYMIPKPLPFLRLGLANLPVMLAVDILPLPAFIALVAIKVLGQGLVGGTLFSYIFVFSAAGSVTSALLMAALRKLLKNRVSWIGISVAGAFASNAAQLTLARFWIFGASAWYIAPPFLAVGTITGILLGAFANLFAERSEWYADVKAGTFVPAELPETTSSGNRGGAIRAFRVVAGLTLILGVMFAPGPYTKGLLTLIAILLVALDRSRIRWLPVMVMSSGIVFFNLLTPFGRVLVSPLGFSVTDGALRAGIEKALTVEGMIFISRWMLRYGIRLPGRAGMLVTEAFEILNRFTLSTPGAKRSKADRKSRKPTDWKRFNPSTVIERVDRVMYGRD